DLDLTIQCPADLSVHADRGAFSRVLMNLVGNAVKFTSNGRIGISAEACDSSAVIIVEDTGIGISNDFRSKLFQPFQRESTGVNRSADGSGLGLAICKQLVE